MGWTIPLMIGGSIDCGPVGRWLKKNVTGTQTGTSNTMPTWDPAFGDLKNMLIKDAQGLLGTNTDLTSQINQGMQDIGAGFRTAGNTLQGALAARGLSNSPVAGTALSNLIASGAGEQSRLMNQQPLMEHELALANMGMAGNILGMGRGTSTTSTGTSTQTGGGGWMDALGGGLGNAAGMMGLLMAVATSAAIKPPLLARPLV